MRSTRVLLGTTLLGLAAAFMSGCTGGHALRPYTVAVGASPRRGRKLIESYGCGSCHTIPGIPSAHGLVGPPLMWMVRRTMIAGELPNSPENLVRWIKDPKKVEPGTAMPDLGLSDQEARDVAAYLTNLR